MAADGRSVSMHIPQWGVPCSPRKGLLGGPSVSKEGWPFVSEVWIFEMDEISLVCCPASVFFLLNR